MVQVHLVILLSKASTLLSKPYTSHTILAIWLRSEGSMHSAAVMSTLVLETTPEPFCPSMSAACDSCNVYMIRDFPPNSKHAAILDIGCTCL